VLSPVVRAQEVIAAIQALAQAYTDYYVDVADDNRAQFRLYHALGRPAQALAGDGPTCPVSPTSGDGQAAPSPAPPGRASLGFED